MRLLPGWAPSAPRRVATTGLAAVALVAAACTSPGGSAPGASASARASASAASTSAVSASTAPSESVAGSGTAAGSAGAPSSGGPDGAVWLPEWADESVPEAVAGRRPLPLCGVERPPAPQPMVFVDRIVRLCFQEAAELGQEAEWVSIQGTMEGGTVATIYRVLGDGTVEVLTDWSQDPFGAGGWTRMTCREVVEAEGDELIGVDDCDEAVPLT